MADSAQTRTRAPSLSLSLSPTPTHVGHANLDHYSLASSPPTSPAVHANAQTPTADIWARQSVSTAQAQRAPRVPAPTSVFIREEAPPTERQVPAARVGAPRFESTANIQGTPQTRAAPPALTREEVPQTLPRAIRTPVHNTRETPQTPARASTNPGPGRAVHDEFPRSPTPSHTRIIPAAPPPSPASPALVPPAPVRPGFTFIHGASEVFGLPPRTTSPAFQLTGPDDPDWRTPQVYIQPGRQRNSPPRYYLIPHPLDLTMPVRRKGKYYVVTRGQRVGIYGSWQVFFELNYQQ